MKKITSHDLKQNQVKKARKWVGWLALCLMMLSGHNLLAQVNAYAFSQSTGVYQSIVADGVAVTESIATSATTHDGSGWTIPIPFAFNFNNQNFSDIYVNSNGGAIFGTPTSTSSAVISLTTAYAGAVGVMNRDLWGIFYTTGVTTTGSNVITNVQSFTGIAVGKVLRTGSGVPANATVTSFDQTAGTITMSAAATSASATASIGWGTGVIYTKVDGEAPNRIFTIQWEGFNDYTTAGSASNYLSFQLKLAETTNTVQIVYGPSSNISTASRTNQIGLRGTTSADFNNRTGAVGNPWTATTAGTTNSATVSRDNLNFPASGLTFTWTPPTCLPPTALSASNITTTGASLAWASNGTLFDVEYGPQGFTLGTGTQIIGVSTPPVLSTLAPSTNYSFYVRTNCGTVDGLSVWAGPFNFTTLCVPVTTFSENFDSYTATGTANPLPVCWSRFGNTGSSSIATASAAPFTAPNRLFLSASATGPTNAVAVMPPVSNLQAETHRLKFKAYCTTANKQLEVGYYEIASDATSFTVLETFDMPSTTQATATEFIYIPEFVPAGVSSLAFRANGGAFTGTTAIYIDDVVWEAIPGCADITAIEISNVTSSTADILWTSEGTETAWDYVYGLSTVTDPNTLTPTTVNNVPYISLSNLTDNTAYKVWIRSNCGNGVFGIWSPAQTFTTACLPVTTFSENFDTYPTGTTSALPNCWVKAGNGTTYLTTGGVAPGTPPNRLYMLANGTAATPTVSLAIMPEVSNLSAGTHRLKFSAYATVANRSIDVGYLSDASDVASFVLLESITLTTTTAATAQTYIYIPTTIPTGITKFALRNAGILGSTTIYVDDVIWEPIPLCPDVNAPVFGSATSTTASISWTPGGSETAWQYAVGLATEMNPLTLTPVDVLTNPQATIPNLLPATSYKVWVRSVCGTNLGAYSQPVTFLTACEPATTFTQNFDTSTTGTTAPMPLCWSRVGNGSVYPTTGGVAPGSAPNRLYMFANGTATVPTTAFAVMPPVSNLQALSHRLRFKAYATSANKTLEVGYFTNMADVNSFVIIQSVNLPSTLAASALEFTVFPNNIPAGVTTLAFRNTGLPTSTTLYIDDVSWEPQPACPDINLPTFVSATDTTATVSWAAGGTETAWEYVIGPASTTDPLTLTPVEVTGATQVVIPNLLPSTAYRVWIRAKCGATSGTYSPFVSFTTACTPISILPWTEGFEGLTTVTTTSTTIFPDCWSKQNGDWASAATGASTYNTPRTGTKYIRNSWSSTNEFMWTPGFQLTAGVSYDFSFYMQGDGFTGWAVDVFRNTVQNSNGATQLGETTIASGTGSYVIQPYALVNNTFVPTTSGTYYFAVRVNQPSGTPWYIAFDDFRLEVTPTCPAPQGISASNVTASSATVSWAAPSPAPANGYDYFVTTATAAPTAETVPTGTVAAGVTTINLLDLSGSTVYYVYVRSLCGTTDIGPWSGAGSFTTPCSSFAVPFVQNFDTFLPNCWSRASAGTAATGPTNSAAGIWLADGFLNAGSTGAVKANLYSTNQIGWLITPTLSTVVGTEYAFAFNYAVTAWNGTTTSAMGSDDTVKVLLTTDNGTTWTEVHTFNAASNIPNTSQLYSYQFVAATTQARFALVATDGTVDDTQDYDFFIDNVAFEIALSNNDFNTTSFAAFPNPVKDILQVKYNENISEVTVINLLGQQLFTKTVNATEGQIDMSALSSGTYLLRVNLGTMVKTIKVIKE